MLGSEILDVAIGLVFVYIVVSVICTAVREGIEAWLKTRAAYTFTPRFCSACARG